MIHRRSEYKRNDKVYQVRWHKANEDISTPIDAFAVAVEERLLKRPIGYWKGTITPYMRKEIDNVILDEVKLHIPEVLQYFQSFTTYQHRQG